MTIIDEWPAIKADIDAGHPSPLGLVTIYSINPADLGFNHQVFAYGYDLDDSNNLTLYVYDPNTSTASADNITISLPIGNPSHSTPITHNVAIGKPIRGFFRVDYTAHDPSYLEPPLSTLQVRVISPSLPLPEGQPVTFTVHAQDLQSASTVIATVTINGVIVGSTDTSIIYTFTPHVTHRRRRVPGTGSGRPGPGDLELVTTYTYPKGQVTASNYQPTSLDFGFHDREEVED
jgi:hypothetical protein